MTNCNAEPQAYVVTVHGWGGSKRSFDTVHWPESMQVLPYEMPGHGERRDEGFWTIPYTAEDLARYIERTAVLPIPVIVVAHSMGGQLSMLRNANHPDLLDMEVVIDPAYGADDEPADLSGHRDVLARLRERPYETMLEFVQGARSPYLREADYRSIISDVRRANGQALADYYWSEYLAPDQIGLMTQTVAMAARRTKPSFGIYRTEDRARFELGLGSRDAVAWGAEHGHYLQLEEPERLASTVADWCELCGIDVRGRMAATV